MKKTITQSMPEREVLMRSVKILVIIITALIVIQAAQSAEDFEPAGIILGDSVIAPGQKAVFVYGNLGFPENIYAIRSKKDQKDDYVKFNYEDHGLIITITNEENIIKAIYVLKRDTKLKGIPFKVGDSYDMVKKAWGEPDKKEQNYANYFHRGVLVRVSDDAKIDLIAIYKPGKIDYDEMKQGKT